MRYAESRFGRTGFQSTFPVRFLSLSDCVLKNGRHREEVRRRPRWSGNGEANRTELRLSEFNDIMSEELPDTLAGVTGICPGVP